MIKDDQQKVTLRDFLRADGISLPVIATKLRTWARQRGDVDRLVLGHNGGYYTLAVLLRDASIECAEVVELELYEMMPFQPGTELHVFTVGGNYSDSKMFDRPHSYVVHDSRLATSERVV